MLIKIIIALSVSLVFAISYNLILRHGIDKRDQEITNLETVNETKNIELNMTSIASKSIGEIQQLDLQKQQRYNLAVGTHTETF